MSEHISTVASTVHVEVLRGTKGFTQACRAAAITLGMVACAQATALPPSERAANTPNVSSVSSDVPIGAREPVAQTPAAIKLKSLLPDQKQAVQPVSPEQMQVLKYGTFPPVKTTVRMNGRTETQWTLHPFDLVRLAREAASKASVLEGIKVDPAKVGAIMIAESSMVSRVGWSANGKTPSFGLAQLEERTARALGVKDLNDPRESALAAARLVAEGQKLARANRHVDPSLVASLAYNTSSSTRKSLISHYGAELRAEHLPQATQNHVKNMAFGEQRMSLFAKLRDQHELTVAASIRALKQVIPQPSPESAMSTARPSTLSLITNVISDNANQARLRSNQVSLERSGHVQAVPMTSKGLSDLHQAIAVHIQRMSSSNPADRSRELNTAPMAVLLATMGERLGTVARSLVETVRETFAELSKDLKAASSTQSPSPTHNAAALTSNQQTAELTMLQTRADIQEMREQQRAAQDHPGFMHG